MSLALYALLIATMQAPAPALASDQRQARATGAVELSPQGATGYFSANLTPPPDGFGYGYSGYTAVSRLGARQVENEQFGWGPWLMPDNRNFSRPLCPKGTLARDHWPERGPTWGDVYQTIEGGAGRWTSTQFPSPSPKFRLNTTPDCYNTEVASTGWSFYQQLLPKNKLGVAQLSNRLVFAPDGLTVEITTSEALLGYAWMALPLIPANASPRHVPTGDQSWTLFLRAANFSGPVAFYTPELYSAVHVTDRTALGTGLDARPALMGSMALEFGNLPMMTSRDAHGRRYRRIPAVRFGVDARGRAMLLQDIRYFAKSALWDGIARWMDGGAPVTGFADSGSVAATLTDDGASLRFSPDAGSELHFTDFLRSGVYPTTGGGSGLGLEGRLLTADGQAMLPEYYREDAPDRWTGIPESTVPRETNLVKATFPPKERGAPRGVNQVRGGPWAPATWRAGPFRVKLNDGSTVEYVWYRFVDQPAIARLPLDAATRERLQGFVEALHRQGGAGIAPAAPTGGTVASLDAAQLVTPPPGLEVGFVPVVIRQH